MTPRRARWAVASALGAALVMAVATPASPAARVPGIAPTTTTTAAAAQAQFRVIVVARGSTVVAAAHVLALGGRITRELALVDGFAATVPARALPVLKADPAIRSITAETTVYVTSARIAGVASDPPPAEPDSMYPQALRADQVWQAGAQGQGVTVAVLDTGVTAGTDLAGRLIKVGSKTCQNLSGEATCDDQYGHGTFVAGVIAGNGAASSGAHVGVAPKAGILSVKVAGPSGATDVSNVLAAIQWVVSHKNQYDIRVLNLSLSTDSVQTYRTDPFNYAVERAWDAGIVVVVSASNRGPGGATISKPGDDPLVITVGAVDDRGSAAIADDELPDFTAHGPTPADGLAKPDVVAPGAHIVSLRAPGSTIDQAYPNPAQGGYLRGSGTSFSAAATSGVVALMLARNPALSPDQVKYALTATARPLPASSDPNAVGAGEVDAAAAALSPPAGSANVGVVRSNGTGLLEASRGHVHVQTTTLPSTVVNGTLTAQLLIWNLNTYLLGWTPLSWLLSPWNVTPLLPVIWSDDDWPGRNWGGRNWGGGTWDGATWAGTQESRHYGVPLEGAIWLGAWG